LISYIQNRDELLSHGAVALREVALDIANKAIAAADPATAARRVLRADNRYLRVGEKTFDLTAETRVFVVGAGKASFPIAKVIDEELGPRIHAGLVVCKNGQTGSLSNIEMLWASHPVPDQASHEAAKQTKALLSRVRSGDIVLSCFTGGSSALFVEPIGSISLQDKVLTNLALLRSGANIVEINAVRKHISGVKGGRLVRSLPTGVHLINLTVSDVIGDPFECISDPSVPDTSSFSDAHATLEKYDLWTRIPAPVVEFLCNASAADETSREADFSHIDRTDILLIKSDAACVAAAAAARLQGFAPLILSTFFEGEARELGRFMVAIAKQIRSDGQPLASPCVLIGGGESTVLLDDDGGRGGPNQEFAVAFAAELTGHDNVVALGLDTDGTDGPTDVAGALVDATTTSRAKSARIDLHRALLRHNVTPMLLELGDAIITGATGTNVNDLKLVLIG
jgi:glycerate 2-kinase